MTGQMNMRISTSGALILAGSSTICAVMGSIHAFSVFLDPLEIAFGLNRATNSLTYSFALVALTISVLLGPRFYGSVSAGMLFALAGLTGAAGAVVAGFSQSIIGVWIGYSIGFGAANGLGYGFALQFVARANPSNAGLAMGIVTAAYAFGAVVSPAIFNLLLKTGGIEAAMMALAFALILASAIAVWLTNRAGVDYEAAETQGTAEMPPTRVVARIWLAYGASVTAGLMVIGHAVGIAELANVTPWLAPSVLAVCNLLGSLFGGRLIDRLSQRTVLTCLPLISMVGLALLVLFEPLTFLALGLVGLAYGGTIAAYPAAIAGRFEKEVGPRVYGWVFTAWGTAGLLAPWFAGLLFDAYQSYGPAIWVAAALALLSSLMAASQRE